MPTTNPRRGRKTMATVSEIDDQIQQLRQQRAALIETERLEREAAENEAIEAYWAERLEQNPEDPEALRAKADILARKNGEAQGSVVQAAQAILQNEGQ